MCIVHLNWNWTGNIIGLFSDIIVIFPSGKDHQAKEWICYNASHMWMQPEYRCYEWVAAACSQCTERQIIKVLNSPCLFHRGREIKSIFTKQILFVCHRTQVSGSQSQFLKRIATILFLPKPKVRGIRISLCIYSFFYESIFKQKLNDLPLTNLLISPNTQCSIFTAWYIEDSSLIENVMHQSWHVWTPPCPMSIPPPLYWDQCW